MPRAGEWAQGIGSGAASGATLGSFAGPWGTAIGGVVGGIGGAIGTAIAGDDEDKRRKEAERLFAQQQALERDAQGWSEAMNYGRGDELSTMFAKHSPIQDTDVYGLQGKHALFNRGQQLDRDRFKAGMREPEGNAWQEWVQPLLDLGSAVSSGFKQDPNAARKAQLNQTADEAGFIRSLPNGTPEEARWLESMGMSGRNISEAENRERTKSALFGPRTRMSAYDF